MAAGNNSNGAGLIVSYNVHGCRGRDGRQDINRCVSVLLGLQPLVVGLQEVDSREGPDVWRIFADTLGMYPLPGPTLFRGSGRYGNLLLSRNPVRRVDHHDLGVSGREPRRAIDAVVEIPGGTLRVILTHLGLRRRERHQQYRKLAELTAAAWDGRPVIVMGDFNEWFTPRRVARRIHPALSCPRPVSTFPSNMPFLALDQILCYPGDLLGGVRTLRNGNARDASDHLPLLADLDPDMAPWE